jgi:hypothetical protein
VDLAAVQGRTTRIDLIWAETTPRGVDRQHRAITIDRVLLQLRHGSEVRHLAATGPPLSSADPTAETMELTSTQSPRPSSPADTDCCDRSRAVRRTPSGPCPIAALDDLGDDIAHMIDRIGEPCDVAWTALAYRVSSAM